jgi:ADP-heptose:LPS heptosyltransferase
MSGTLRTHRDRWARRAFDLAAALTPRRRGVSPRTRIGVFLLWGIGDAVLTTPFLRALRNAYPEAHLVGIGKPWLPDLFAGETLFDEFVTLVPPWTRHSDKYRLWSSAWRIFGREVLALRRARLDLLISLRPDPRETALGRLLGVREFAGYAAPGGRSWVSVDLGRGVANEPTCYRGELAARAAEALLGTLPDPVPALGHDPVPDVARRLAEAGYAGGPVLAVAFGAAHPIRRWHSTGINDTLRKLRRPPGAYLIIESDGSPRFEAPGAIPTVRWEGPLAALKDVLGVADVLLCTDSGALHIGTAVGCRTVAIFGPGARGRFAPPGPPHVSYAVEPMPCRPCYDNCIYPSPLCMDRIDTGAVATLVDDALAQIAAPRARAAAESVGA